MEASTKVMPFSERRHDLSRTGLGGSDAAAVLGLSKYRTPLDVWMNCTGRAGPDEQSEAAEWGQRLESEVLRKYAEGLAADEILLGRDREGRLAQYAASETGKVAVSVLRDGDPVVEAFGHLFGTLRHPERPHLMAHIDALVVGSTDGFRAHFEVRRLVDAKTAGHWASKDWGEEGTDETPEDYIVQAQHYAGILAALGYDVAQVDIPALFAGQQYRLFHVPVSITLYRRVHDRLDEWWRDYVETDSMPPVRAEDNRTLSVLYPEDSGESVFAPAELSQWAQALGEYRDLEKETKANKGRCEAEIKAAMGDASEIVGDGWRATWKKAKDSERTDWEAVVTDLRTRLELYLSEPTIEPTGVLDMIAEATETYTETKPGSRRFLTYGYAKTTEVDE